MTVRRIPLDYVDDILDGMSYEQFSRDDKTVYAVTQALEVIGEATRCIPERSGRTMLLFPGQKWLVCVTN